MRKLLKKLLVALAFAVSACVGFFSASVATADFVSVQSSLLQREIKRAGAHSVFLIAQEKNYPQCNNAAQNLLNSTLTYRYADQIKTYMVAYPHTDSENTINPFSYDMHGTQVVAPLFALSYWGGYSPSDIKYLAEPMFGNIVYSPDLGIDKVYITEDTATALLDKENPTKEDFQTLIGSRLASKTIANGIYNASNMEVVDILTKESYEWLSKIYGNNFVVGGYKLVNSRMVDGFEMHTMLVDDFYQLHRFLQAYNVLAIEKLSLTLSYKSVENGEDRDLQVASELASITNAPTRKYVASFLFIFNFSLCGFLTFISCKRKFFNFNETITGSSAIFATVVMIQLFMRPTIIKSWLPCALTNVGGTIVFVCILLYLALLIRANKEVRQLYALAKRLSLDV